MHRHASGDEGGVQNSGCWHAQAALGGKQLVHARCDPLIAAQHSNEMGPVTVVARLVAIQRQSQVG